MWSSSVCCYALFVACRLLLVGLECVDRCMMLVVCRVLVDVYCVLFGLCC